MVQNLKSSIVNTFNTVAEHIEAALTSNEQKLKAAILNNDTDTANALIAKGVDPNAKMGGGNSFLHLAARGGHDKVMEHLISKGAKVNALNDKKETPLITASFFAHPKAVSVLLKNEADVTIFKKHPHIETIMKASPVNYKEVGKLLGSAAKRKINVQTSLKAPEKP